MPVNEFFTPETRKVMLDAFRAARRISTPLVAILTLDYASTLVQIGNDLQDRAAICAWDIVRGLYGQNEAGAEAVRELLGPNVDSIAATRNPGEGSCHEVAHAPSSAGAQRRSSTPWLGAVFLWCSAFG
jgi:hypothetical protein